jgi:5-formyltetrahydrofolate cyclo-ligase
MLLALWHRHARTIAVVASRTLQAKGSLRSVKEKSKIAAYAGLPGLVCVDRLHRLGVGGGYAVLLCGDPGQCSALDVVW